MSVTKLYQFKLGGCKFSTLQLNFVNQVLVNDQASTDNELIKHLEESLSIPTLEACYIVKRFRMLAITRPVTFDVKRECFVFTVKEGGNQWKS